jgi:hypothetical protein
MHDAQMDLAKIGRTCHMCRKHVYNISRATAHLRVVLGEFEPEIERTIRAVAVSGDLQAHRHRRSYRSKPIFFDYCSVV